MTAETEEAFFYFRYKHGIKDPSEIEATPTPGYWRIKAGCPGGESCTHGFRVAGYSCDGKTDLTISYFSGRDEKGRFQSPYTAWKEWRDMQGHERFA